MKLARQTYNSRSETTATKPSFRHAWRERQFCVIPAESIFEPCYETGTAVRWEIRHRRGDSLGIAGIWEVRISGNGKPPLVSFSMLTVNADDDPLMQRFHKPGDEKRSVVFLPPERYQAWLDTTIEEAPDFLKLFPPEELTASPTPRNAPKRATLFDDEPS
jgi:putative SOS response-associated peptidase YedK